MNFGIWLLVFIVSILASAFITVFLDLMKYREIVAGVCFAVFSIIANSLVKRGLVKDAKRLAERIALPQFSTEDKDKLESYLAKSQVQDGLTESEFIEMEKLSKVDRVHFVVRKAAKSEDMVKSEIKELIKELGQISKEQN